MQHRRAGQPGPGSGEPRARHVDPSNRMSASDLPLGEGYSGMSGVFLVLASFLASAVEMVEALTIVLAAGVTRGWRSSLVGVGAALVALAAICAVLGPALTAIPIAALQLVVGTLLLIFGLQWLRK